MDASGSLRKPLSGAANAPAMPVPAATGDVATRLDALPVTRQHVGIVALCTTAFAFDLYEVGIGSALGAVFSGAGQGVSATELAWLLSSLYIGAVAGASVFGWVADKVGRRRVLAGLMLLMGATALLAAASPNIAWLTTWRLVMGLAVGAFPPILFAFLTDLMPPRRRGLMIFITVGIAFLGAPLGIFLMRYLTGLQPFGLEGWRSTFVIGALGALVCAWLFRYLPESPRWLEATGRRAEALETLARFERSTPVMAADGGPAAPVNAATVRDPRSLRTRFARLSLLCFLTPWATIAFPLLTGAVLTAKGFKLSDTLLYVGLANFGPVLGTLIAAFVVDRFERRIALAALSLGMGLAGLLFVLSSSPLWLIIASACFTMFAAVHAPTLNVYGAELFPTTRRASAVSGAWAFNRAGAALAPLVLLPLLRANGPVAMMMVVGLALLASLALLAVSSPRRPGIPVE